MGSTCSSTLLLASPPSGAPGAMRAAKGSCAGATVPFVPLPPKASIKNGARVRFAAARTRVWLLAENASTRALALVLQAAKIVPPPRKGTRVEESATSRRLYDAQAC